MRIKLFVILLAVARFCNAQTSVAKFQHHLDKRITLNIKHEPVSEILNKISKAGNFYFSYSGTLFKQDSIMSINVKGISVRGLLDTLFNGKMDYKEIGEHIILRYAANHLTIEPDNIITAEHLYLISEYVIDIETGRKVKQASVYEKRLLQSTLTDNSGYFKLRFKGDHNEVILTASKENYKDTSLVFLSNITIKPKGYDNEDSENGNNLFNSIENSGISRFFVSSRQRIQSLNIPDFFANTPFQASLTRGISSHGIMSSQVINKVSLNVLGGYTAGVNGIELAGMFNITKGNVKKLQIAGLFNGVGGSVNGMQVAGLMNDIKTDVHGVQVAGLFNHVKENMGGIQIAGLGNISSNNLKGMQIGGLFNYAKETDGVQIGLINISGKNTGYSIGLINYVRSGYHKISLSTNETINSNISIKTGNANLYNIIILGKNFSDTAKVLTAGLGLGHDFMFNNRLSVATELSSQYLYLGNWAHANFLSKFQINLQVQLVKGLTVFGGPVYSIYESDAPAGSSSDGYKQQIEPYKRHNFSENIKGWFGWNVGITIM